MKKIISSFLIGSTLFFGSNSVKADEAFGIATCGNLSCIYSVDVNTGNKTLLSSKDDYFVSSGAFVSSKTGELILQTNSQGYRGYNWKTNTWRDIDFDDMTIYGEPAVYQNSSGETHIGENSWITKEESGRQKVYAKDAAGDPIPIDYTNGTKLLINGRDVEQSINNVGALSAALTGLPTVPTDTTLACGLGTGTHGGDFAFSGGCASKVNEKLSFNYAASMTMPGQDYAGDFEDTFSARAGFVWKLGKSIKPTQISMKSKEKMEVKINSLEEKNQNLENTVSTLMAKLEHLEKIALGDYKSDDLATMKLP